MQQPCCFHGYSSHVVSMVTGNDGVIYHRISISAMSTQMFNILKSEFLLYMYLIHTVSPHVFFKIFYFQQLPYDITNAAAFGFHVRVVFYFMLGCLK